MFLSLRHYTTVAGSCTAGFADGSATGARLRHPHDVAMNPRGSILYVADSSNRRVRAVSLTAMVWALQV